MQLTGIERQFRTRLTGAMPQKQLVSFPGRVWRRRNCTPCPDDGRLLPEVRGVCPAVAGEIIGWLGRRSQVAPPPCGPARKPRPAPLACPPLTRIGATLKKQGYWYPSRPGGCGVVHPVRAQCIRPKNAYCCHRPRRWTERPKRLVSSKFRPGSARSGNIKGRPGRSPQAQAC